MNDNTNLEKITKTILLMTEGESRRDGGGEGREEERGFPARTSRMRHYINQPLISVSRQVIFCSSCSFSLADWKKICQNNYFEITEIKSKQEDLGCRTLLTSGRKMLEC